MDDVADRIAWSESVLASLAAQIGLALPRIAAGLLIILYQPFRTGDRIQVAGSAGTVIGINLRYTVLDAGDRRILVPNGTLFSNTVTVERLGAEPPGRG
jgi:small conductance mechanosensitive channel